MKKTILIFGISSFVGSSLAEYLKRHYRVVGTYFQSPMVLKGVLCIPCNILQKDEVHMIIYTIRPDVIIYAVGVGSMIEAALNPKMADGLNTAGLFTVSEYGGRYKAKVCYISSAFVFGGEKKLYKEIDVPDPNSVYGSTLLAGEYFLQKTSLNYLIFRCCNLYGKTSTCYRPYWFDHLQNLEKLGKTFMLDDNVKVGFLDVVFLAHIIHLCLEKNTANRLLQLSSKDVMGFYEFALKYCEIFKKRTDNISKGRWKFPFTLVSSANVTTGEMEYKLSTQNLENYLRCLCPTIEESLKFSFEKYQKII